ncbi:MAG: hypothetical protein OXH75_13130 [Acidobacteria bacterium]|nr:hypothetical protein [Acidobacteriota bacterium]
MGELFFRLGGGATEPGAQTVVCHDCAVDSGWAKAIKKAMPRVPPFHSATLLRRTDDGTLYLGVTMPPAIPGLVAAAFGLAVPIANNGTRVAIKASNLLVGKLVVIVSGGSDAEAVDLAATCAVWLTAFASRVAVPSQMYRRIREVVYDSGGIRRARRLVRQHAT